MANGIPVIKQVTDQTDMPILTGEDMYGLDEYPGNGRCGGG